MLTHHLQSPHRRTEGTTHFFRLHCATTGRRFAYRGRPLPRLYTLTFEEDRACLAAHPGGCSRPDRRAFFFCGRHTSMLSIDNAPSRVRGAIQSPVDAEQKPPKTV